MLDAFGGGGGAESVAIATAESIEFDFITPGGRKETVIREIFDRVGRARRLKGARLAAGQAATGDAGNPDDFVQGMYGLFVATGAIDRSHLKGLDSSTPSTDEQDIDVVAAGLTRINIAFSATSDAVLGRIADAATVLRTYVDTPRQSSSASIAAKPGYPTVIVPFAFVEPTRPGGGGRGGAGAPAAGGTGNAPGGPGGPGGAGGGGAFPPDFDPKPSPFGVSFTGMACSEPQLIELAFAFEQVTKRRVAPKLAP